MAATAVALLAAWAFGPHWLSPHDAGRIQVGMTREEVEGIIGRPADEEWNQTELVPQFHPPGQSRIRLVWEGTPVSVRVIFAADRAEWVYVESVFQNMWDRFGWIVTKITKR